MGLYTAYSSVFLCFKLKLRSAKRISQRESVLMKNVPREKNSLERNISILDLCNEIPREKIQEV